MPFQCLTSSQLIFPVLLHIYFAEQSGDASGMCCNASGGITIIV